MTALLKLIFIEIKGSKLKTTEICSHEKYANVFSENVFAVSRE